MPYGDLTGSRSGRGAKGGGSSYGAGTKWTGGDTKPRTRKAGNETFLARYPGTCKECGTEIRVGDIITRLPAHLRCPESFSQMTREDAGQTPLDSEA